MRRILVTGAASGIGAATCRRLAARDAAIMVHTRRNRDGAERVAAAVRNAGGAAEVILGDLAQPDAAGEIVAETVRRLGGLDVLVSNAGFADRTKLATLTDDAMAASLDAIQWAFFRLARAALTHLAVGTHPRIVAVSSFVAHEYRTDLATFPASAAAKAGMEALVQALAVETGAQGITVNAVVPGFIRKDAGAHRAIDPAQLAAQTAKIPLGRIGLPEEVAAAIAFLASPDASYITGQKLHVSGGLVI